MAVLSSNISPSSQAFRDNSAHMHGLLEEVGAVAAKVEKGGSEQARERHLSRGKLLPRERIRRLLDANSPFLEIGQFAAHDMYGGDISSAGLITGIGQVEGRDVMIVCNDATVKGGTYFPVSV
ncbi:MAG: carboxyl transferase domain-containing protein, partial [Pseudomonadota bacterium]